ncbi:MOSC N-terminal beta barrel domain-containing protein [Blastococcus sp. TML/M2B]|uniref:MOSC N-terminal beta barrel domain-containing protein n=1 Tax=unclassified Blastococcus TaxID=2619396 RepID=UPI00190D2538|nr:MULTISPECIES: MOSC N-terminal beta barrel domain-containing protein [unclassified Blastococcus]MBN1092491.1 MOSC N-terminal beta barrel domain-containing protein [Blastococcus sp. TML/M2B]MBN1097414.1 MOSC N-terminal beta barrel domain-containing protein [Blastococcus sp. TML/C7B]
MTTTTAGHVAGIWIYPVKSLGGTARERVRLAASGPEGDRAWAVVDAGTGEVVRGKHAPALAGIAPSGDPDADARAVAAALGRGVRLQAAEGSAADAAAVHLVSRQAIDRAVTGDVPEGCSADDPRANLVLDLPDGEDERTWVGRTLRIGSAELAVTRTPKHCLGVYAEVRRPGEVSVGDAVLL